MREITLTTILMVPVIIVIAIGSVILISKVGGKTASKKIRYLHGIDDEYEEHEEQE